MSGSPATPSASRAGQSGRHRWSSDGLAPQASLEQSPRGNGVESPARLAQEYPGTNDQFGVVLQPIRELCVSGLRPALLILFGAVMFVLLIACANVANLFLMRGAGRTKEIALRIALGASRGRIIRQLLVESFMLATLGGVFGLALAAAGINGIARLIPMDMLAGATVNLNGMVLLFAGVAVVLSAFLFGLAPAVQLTKPGVQSELKDGGRSTASGQNRWRAVLAVAEISLALVLLVGAGLMMKSLYRLLAVDPGVRPDRVLTMEMSLRKSHYDKDITKLNFWQQTAERVRALPGVESVALGTSIPLTGDHARADITIEGMALPKPGSFTAHPDSHTVSPGYARTLGVPVLRTRKPRIRGRGYRGNAPPVTMINAMDGAGVFPKEESRGQANQVRASFGLYEVDDHRGGGRRHQTLRTRESFSPGNIRSVSSRRPIAYVPGRQVGDRSRRTRPPPSAAPSARSTKTRRFSGSRPWIS